MPKFLNRLVVVVVMLGLLSWVAANALILLPFELSEWWSTFVWCFVVIWLVLDNVSLCAGINALLLAVAVSVEDSNKALVGAGDALEQLEKPFVPVGLLIIMLAGLADLPLEDECPKACPPRPVLPMGMRIWNVLRFQDSFFFPTSFSPTFLKL